MCPDGPVGPQGPGVATRFTFAVHSTLALLLHTAPNTDTDINTVARQTPRGRIPFHLHTLNTWPHPWPRLSNVSLVRKHFSAQTIWTTAPTQWIAISGKPSFKIFNNNVCAMNSLVLGDRDLGVPHKSSFTHIIHIWPLQMTYFTFDNSRTVCSLIGQWTSASWSPHRPSMTPPALLDSAPWYSYTLASSGVSSCQFVKKKN